MINKKLLIFGAVLVLAVGLTACQGSEKKETETTAKMTEKEAESAAETEAASAEDKERGAGGTADVSGTASSDAAEEVSADKAPDFTATLTDGTEFTLRSAEGKPVLLNFWATWCGPCVGEMPAFEKLYKEYGDQVQILAVDCMEDTATVDAFIAKNGYTFPIAYDVDGSIGEKYPTDGIPYTLVIDPDGNVAQTFLGSSGADAQYQAYKAAIEEVLK